MGALEYDSQIDALVDCGRLDEAISLLGMLEDALLKDKEGRLREIKMLKAQNLFDLRRYRESLDLFTEVSAPPERVIRLFPPIIAGQLSAQATAINDDENGENPQGHDVKSVPGRESTNLAKSQSRENEGPQDAMVSHTSTEESQASTPDGLHTNVSRQTNGGVLLGTYISDTSDSLS